MGKTFDVAVLSADEAITIRLRDGSTLRAQELLPEVVDGLGQVIDNRAKEQALEEVERRRLFRILEDQDAEDEAYADASSELTQLTTRSAQRGRVVAYEQLTHVFRDENGERLSVEYLKSQIPLPVANRISDELTRQILGRMDAEGNAEASAPAPTETASTS